MSLGHSGATLAQARAAIEAGARHATHLFNRMPPLGHREPGLAGADSDERGGRRGNHLRRRARASRHGAHGDRRQRRRADDGDYRRRRGRGIARGIDGIAWRPHDSREELRRLPRRRHAGRQRGDDGSRVSISGQRGRPLAERRGAALRHHTRLRARPHGHGLSRHRARLPISSCSIATSPSSRPTLPGGWYTRRCKCSVRSDSYIRVSQDTAVRFVRAELESC